MYKCCKSYGADEMLLPFTVKIGFPAKLILAGASQDGTLVNTQETWDWLSRVDKGNNIPSTYIVSPNI